MRYLIMLCVFFCQFTYALNVGFNIHPSLTNSYEINHLLSISGVNTIRTDYTWQYFEKNKGEFKSSGNLIGLKNILNKNKNLINNVLVLDYGNKIYFKSDYPENNNEIDYFSKYAVQVVKSNPGNIYSIWNEWLQGTGVKSKPPQDPKFYFDLVKKTSVAIKKADPDAKIIIGDINPSLDFYVQWYKSLLQLGIDKYIDGVSIHAYSWGDRDAYYRKPIGMFELIKNINSLGVKYSGREIPLYITEFGYSDYKGEYSTSLSESNNYFIDFISLMKSLSYVKGVWIYDLYNDGANKNDMESNFGFYNSDGSSKYDMSFFKRFFDFVRDDNVIFSTTNKYNDQQILVTCMNVNVGRFKLNDNPNNSSLLEMMRKCGK